MQKWNEMKIAWYQPLLFTRILQMKPMQPYSHSIVLGGFEEMS